MKEIESIIRYFFYNECKGDGKLFLNSINEIPFSVKKDTPVSLPQNIKMLLNQSTLSYKEDSDDLFAFYREYFFDSNKMDDLFYIFVFNNKIQVGLVDRNSLEKANNYCFKVRKHNIQSFMSRHPHIAQTLIKNKYYLSLSPSLFYSRGVTILKLLDLVKHKTNFQILSLLIESDTSYLYKIYPDIYKNHKEKFSIIPILKNAVGEYISDFYTILHREIEISKLAKKIPQNYKTLIDKTTFSYLNDIVILKKQKEYAHDFCPKISRYKTTEELNSALKLFLSNVSGWTIDIIENKLKELNIDYYIDNERIYASINDYETMTKIGSSQWCIATNIDDWHNYLVDEKYQYIVFDFKLPSNNPKSMVGYTALANGQILHAHDKNDAHFPLNDPKLQTKKINVNDFMENLQSKGHNFPETFHKTSLYYSFHELNEDLKTKILCKKENISSFLLNILDLQLFSNITFIFDILLYFIEKNELTEEEVITISDKFLNILITEINYKSSNAFITFSEIIDDKYNNIISKNSISRSFFQISKMLTTNSTLLREEVVEKFLRKYKGDYLWREFIIEKDLNYFILKFINNHKYNPVILRHFDELREKLVQYLLYSQMVPANIKNKYFEKLNSAEQLSILRYAINTESCIWSLKFINYKKFHNINILNLCNFNVDDLSIFMDNYASGDIYSSEFYSDLIDYALKYNLQLSNFDPKLINTPEFYDVFMKRGLISCSEAVKQMTCYRLEIDLVKDVLFKIKELSDDLSFRFYYQSLIEYYDKKSIKSIP